MLKNNKYATLKLYKVISFIKENKIDCAKFVFYTCFFSYLLFTWQKAYSPIGEPSYDSASEIESQQPIDETSQDDTFALGKKIQKKPILTLELNPDYVKVDETLLKALKFNIESKFFKDKVTPLDLTIDSTRIDPRGRVTGTNLMLSGKIKDLSESMKVFVHELGHLVDLHYLSSVGDYDPSENFYNISWLSYNVKKKGSKMTDFLSGYALTNKYEDFAESFTFYVFHNDDFKNRALKNIIVARKYNFFKKYVFINSEFANTGFENNQIAYYNWDATKIPINLKKYLYYIR